MDIEGTIMVVGDVNVISEKFSKRELVIETSEVVDYTETICIEFQQKKMSLLNDFNVGDYVKVDFNLKGRSWQKDENSAVRYFNTLQGWRIGQALPRAVDVNPLSGQRNYAEPVQKPGYEQQPAGNTSNPF